MTPELAKVLGEAVAPAYAQESELLPYLQKAEERVAHAMAPSPLRPSAWLSELLGADVWLKLECFNPNGSFKVRGALNAIASRLALRAGMSRSANPNLLPPLKVCAASAGNHAQGVAFAAKQMGCEAHIFLPKRTPLVKREATERLGANVYLVGDVLEEAFEAALAFAHAEGGEFIHAFNDFDVIIGQATCATEVLRQFTQATGKPASAIDAFLCGIGGGGLAAGAGLVMRLFAPTVKVVGVEQEHFDSAARSLAEGTRLPVGKTGQGTIADGISVRMIGNLTFDFLHKYTEKVLLVSDDDIVSAVLGLCEREHVVAEGAGAAAVAALLKNKAMYKGRTVVACVSGGNIDPQLLSRVIARGLGVTGRILRLTARLGDRPGQLKSLLEQIALLDANVLEVYHDRTYAQVNVGDVEVELALETRNFEHQYELLERLGELGFRPKIPQDSFAGCSPTRS